MDRKLLSLRLAILLLGRFARYRMEGKAYLPVLRCRAYDQWPINEPAPPVDEWDELAVVYPDRYVRIADGGFPRVQTVIKWATEPNAVMVPLNWPARIIHALALSYWGGLEFRKPWVTPQKPRPKVNFRELYDYGKKNSAGS